MKELSLLFTFPCLRRFFLTFALAPILMTTVRCLGAPGQLDISFNGTGTISGLGFFPYEVAIQNDGKILVAGVSIDTSTANYVSYLKMRRYHSDGTIDSTFQSSGNLIAAKTILKSKLALQADGKILVAASASDDGQFTDFFVLRLKSDGSLDSSFGGTGKVTANIGKSDYLDGIALQNDGKVVVTGTTYTNIPQLVMMRYRTDGSLDTTFNGTGNVTIGVSGLLQRVTCMALQSDGQIVVAGYSDSSSNADFVLMRFTSTGAFDRNFGSGGSVTTDFGGGLEIPATVAILSDGRILVGGSRYLGTPTHFFSPCPAIACYTSAGVLDPGFGLAGRQVINFDGEASTGFSMAVQRDGKILIAGGTSGSQISRGTLARLTSGGMLDVTFGNGGKMFESFDNSLGSIALQSDGRIVAAGNGSNVVARLLGDGRKAQITSPANGSTLTSTSLPLVWNAGLDAAGYVLWAGTTPGGYDVHVSYETGTSRTLTIPAGKRIHVTLWTLLNGSYQPNHYVFEPPSAVAAMLLTPVTLSGGTVVLNWKPGVGASRYSVWLGSSRDGRDLGEADAGTTTTWAFNNLPQDGGPIYVTLWSLINGKWEVNRNWFAAAASPAGVNRSALLTSPANGSALTSVALDLKWDAGVGTTGHALWVGSTPGSYDISATKEGGNLAKTLIVPGDGRIIYVTLFSFFGSTYQTNSYYFTTASLPDDGAAQITIPVRGSTFSPNGSSFSWAAAPGATQYYLHIGNTPGGHEFYAASQGTNLGVSLPSMPQDGRPLYVTLYSWMFNAWKPSSTWCYAANTGAGEKPSLMLSPGNDTTLPGASATFQ